MKPKLTLILAALAIFAMPWAGQAGDIIWARDGDIDTLDPHRATSTLSRQVWFQIYDSLLEFDAQGRVVPNLAKDWSVSDDGKRITLVLNEGIKCHDGTDFNSSDVIWTIDRALSGENPSLTMASWGPIIAYEAPSALTVELTLEKPFGALVPFLADQFTSMLCDSNADSKGFGTSKAVGTGPWKFVSWTKGSEIVLEANKKYQRFGRLVETDGGPLSDRLVIRTVPEAQTRLAGLRTGELHIITPPIQDVPALRDAKNVDVHVASATGQNVFLQFAVNRPPFNDARARRAVSHAINKDAVLKLVYGDLVQREYCPVSVGVFGNDHEFCRQHDQNYDPGKARELLSELGYGSDNPMPVTLATWTGDSRERIVQVMQNMMQQAGMKVSIEVMDPGTINARSKQENNKDSGPGYIDLMGWTWFDPDILYLLWHSPGAYDGYHTPVLDALLEQTRTATTTSERRKAVHGAIKILLEEAVHVPFYTPGWTWIYAVSNSRSGFKLAPFNRPLFNDITS